MGADLRADQRDKLDRWRRPHRTDFNRDQLGLLGRTFGLGQPRGVNGVVNPAEHDRGRYL